jgi:indolepyruvate ferredoxin oxidoreductase, beta subunit
MSELNIILAGVGGQGIILASEVLAEVAIKAGLDVKKSDVHGMAQRGGSVVSFVRIANKVASPLIRIGEADMLISFERLESLRWIGYLKSGSQIVLNDQIIIPPSVASGNDSYPDDIENQFDGYKLLKIDGLQLATDAGNSRAVNSVLLGVLSNAFDYKAEIWMDEIKKKLPEKLHSINTKAFEMGREAGSSYSW